MPFMPEARNGDFLFYEAIDSVLPNPFSSIKDMIPSNRLEILTDIATYPYCFSSLHYSVESKDVGRITQAFEKLMMKIYNDLNGDNMFTLAIKSKDPRIIFEAMKNLSGMSPEELVTITELFPLEGVMS